MVTSIGYAQTYGFIAAAGSRADFPSQRERLLLRVAANEAAVALHHAQLTAEQDRLEMERAQHLGREQVARAEAERARAVAESERGRLRDIFSRVPAVIAVSGGRDHIFQYVNPMMEKLTGRRARDLLGKPLRGVFPELEGQGLFGLLEEVMVTGQAVFRMEGHLRWRLPGSGALAEGYFNLACLPVRNAAREVEGVVTHAVDVSEQVRSRQRVEELVKQLEHERADLEATLRENAVLYELARGKAALEERQRLARELHDSVSQALYGIALNASAAIAVKDVEPDRLQGLLTEVLGLSEAAMAEMRALIFELRPESLEQEGLVAALEKQAAAVRARHGIDIRCSLESEPVASISVKEAVYRIAQEALQNTIKHARAHSVLLALEVSSRLILLRISDDGIGFDTAGEFPGHLGLRSMRERAAVLGGELEVVSFPGAGTCLAVRIPLNSSV